MSLDLQNHEEVTVPGTYRDAMRWLARPRFVKSSGHRNQLWRAARQGAEEDLLRWLDAVVREFGRHGIPVHAKELYVSPSAQIRMYVMGESQKMAAEAPFAEGRACSLVHSIRGHEMPDIAWSVFGHIGLEVAKINQINMIWGGRHKPSYWELTL